MHKFLTLLVDGLTTGALYALLALGYSMVYGVLKLLNFAHGDLYMIGAFIGYFVIQWFGGSAHLSIPVPLLLVIMFGLAAGGTGLLGVAIERFAYRPLRDAPRIAPLITALGVSFFLENAVLLLFGSQTKIYNTSDFISFNNGIHIGALNIDVVRIMIIVLSIVLMFGLRDAGRPHQAGQADARGGGRPRGGRDARHQRRLHDRRHVLSRLGPGRRGRGDVGPGLQPGLQPDRLRGRAQGVHRRGRRRHRLDRRRGARRASSSAWPSRSSPATSPRPTPT